VSSAVGKKRMRSVVTCDVRKLRMLASNLWRIVYFLETARAPATFAGRGARWIRISLYQEWPPGRAPIRTLRHLYSDSMVPLCLHSNCDEPAFRAYSNPSRRSADLWPARTRIDRPDDTGHTHIPYSRNCFRSSVENRVHTG
jgi:hypothetical protein